jgi:hypothetical protein
MLALLLLFKETMTSKMLNSLMLKLTEVCQQPRTLAPDAVADAVLGKLDSLRQGPAEDGGFSQDFGQLSVLNTGHS